MWFSCRHIFSARNFTISPIASTVFCVCNYILRGHTLALMRERPGLRELQKDQVCSYHESDITSAGYPLTHINIHNNKEWCVPALGSDKFIINARPGHTRLQGKSRRERESTCTKITLTHTAGLEISEAGKIVAHRAEVYLSPCM